MYDFIILILNILEVLKLTPNFRVPPGENENLK